MVNESLIPLISKPKVCVHGSVSQYFLVRRLHPNVGEGVHIYTCVLQYVHLPPSLILLSPLLTDAIFHFLMCLRHHSSFP